MKNRILLFLGSAALCSVVLTGCSEDDAIAPQISLIGAADTVIAKGSVWNDPLAIATDDVDGDISSGIVVSGSVNTNVAGVYELTYTATDEAGNSNSVTRTVTVSWTGALLAVTYSVSENCNGNPDSYTSVATSSTQSAYRVLFSNLGNVFTGPTYADIVADELTIPLQTPNGTGSDYEVSGSGTITQTGSVIRWDIQFTIREISTNFSTTCTAQFVSQ
ncbi:MAG: hypothetical protein RL213_2160 [Bacteroidota bacterium]|jgi:hypothetical protein